MRGFAHVLFMSPRRSSAGEAPVLTGRRLAVVDVARGLALAAMAAYHAVWDAGFLNLTSANYALQPGGRLAANLIAGSFLFLVGIGLVLMNRGTIRWRPFLIRIARIAAAAAAITLVTYVVFPDSYIFFGILHCIALASLLALPFLVAPPVVAAVAAVAAFAAPQALRHALFDAAPLVFLGLGERLPETNDYVPLFPYFGLVLAGLAVARLGLPLLEHSRLAAWEPRAGLARLLALAGRYSLPIYLVHQPVLLALAFGLVSLTGPHARVGEADFRAEYEKRCILGGGGADACRIAARCTGNALRRDGLWGRGIAYTLEERAHAQLLSRTCYQAAEGTVPPP